MSREVVKDGGATLTDPFDASQPQELTPEQTKAEIDQFIGKTAREKAIPGLMGNALG